MGDVERLSAMLVQLGMVPIAKGHGIAGIRWFETGSSHSSAADVMSYYLSTAQAALAGAIQASDHREVDFILPRTRFPRGPGFRAALMRTACEASRLAKWWESDFRLYASAKAADTWGTARITHLNLPLLNRFQAISDAEFAQSVTSTYTRTLGEWVAGHKEAIIQARMPR